MANKVESYLSLDADVNKIGDENKTDEQKESIGKRLPELELSLKDDELIELAKKWEEKWKPYEAKIKKKQDTNEKYWLGKHYDENEYTLDDIPLQDNRLFMALETFLPIASSSSPEPIVDAGNTDEGLILSQNLSSFVMYQADIQKLKLKIKQLLRYWSLYYLGCAKVGWDFISNDIETKVLRPQTLILDPEATIENNEYTGNYIGHIRKNTAAILKKQFPSKSEFINKQTSGKDGTEIQYTEWWTKDYVFWKYKDEILDKAKNPHWNYNEENTKTDEYGNVAKESITGSNHFNVPQMPFIFLSVFNLGKQPHDETTLIEQNLPLQKKINKRIKQIDLNVDDMNGGCVVSGEHFTKDQAKQVSATVRTGGTVYVPTGSVQAAYKRETGTPLPGDVYNDLVDARNEIDNIFGTHSTTRGERGATETASGRILLKGADESRIGGGITEYVEQWCDSIFNWWIQLMYVYYTEEHTAAVLGEEKMMETVILINTMLLNKKVSISVKNGSMIPKDPLMKRNEAIDLWAAGALDPITLFSRLDFPNPKEAARKLFLWMNNPGALFPEEMAQMQPQMPPGMPTSPVNGTDVPQITPPPTTAQVPQMMPPQQTSVPQMPAFNNLS
jgi:hypothetical protein